jgi:HTH-type transcriptional regulator/antitoxin MqsA
MKCPECGTAELQVTNRDISYSYLGTSVTIPDITGSFCPACSEVILDRENGDRFSRLVGISQTEILQLRAS